MTRLVVLVTLVIAAMTGLPLTQLHAQEPDTCDRVAMDDVIGATSFSVTNVVYEIAAYAPNQIVRYLRPGEDPGFERSDRLTVVFDGDGRVIRVYCG